jgi:hypothetical protein
MYDDNMPTTAARRTAPKTAASKLVELAAEAVEASNAATLAARTFLDASQAAEQAADRALLQSRIGDPRPVYTIGDIGRAIDSPRQSVQGRYARSQAEGGESSFPPPDLRTLTGRPLWWEETLIEAGILPRPVSPEGEPVEQAS